MTTGRSIAVNYLDRNAMVLRNNGNANNGIMIDPVGSILIAVEEPRNS